MRETFFEWRELFLLLAFLLVVFPLCFFCEIVNLKMEIIYDHTSFSVRIYLSSEPRKQRYESSCLHYLDCARNLQHMA